MKKMSMEEIDGNDKISVKHKNGSLKVEINSDSEDDDITFVNKQPLHPRDRLRLKTKDDDIVFVKKTNSASLR